MIVIRLYGGLGNQLFQWALGVALQARGKEVAYETSGLDHNEARRYMLSDLGLELPIVKLPASYDQINEVNMQFTPAVLYLKGSDWVLNGYWQSEKYLADVAVKIREAVFEYCECSRMTMNALCDIANSGASCFIHVRRSDNLRPTSTLYHGLTDPMQSGYYKHSIAYMRQTYPGIKFFVFSDDPDWCNAYMSDHDMIVVGHNRPSFTVDATNNLHRTSDGREVEDLYLMSLCDHAIIANSTFSWWGAWLGPDMRGEVISPTPWFTGQHDLDESNIIPERWLRFGR